MSLLLIKGAVEGELRLEGAFSVRSRLPRLSVFVSTLKVGLNRQQQAEVAIPKLGDHRFKCIAVTGGQFGVDFSIGLLPFHHLLRRLVCIFDGKARAGAGQGVNPLPRPDASPFRSPKKKEAMMARIKRALARIEDHWLADLIGAVSLFVLLFGGLFLGLGMGLQ